MDILDDTEDFYRKVEYFNKERTEKLSYHYREILKLLGEDPEREGLEKTPYRVAKAMQFITKGYHEDPEEILRSALLTAVPLLFTGGIHMDGFMDTCDAMASWGDREKKLAILKDSHTGAFAVMACSLYILLYTAGCTEFTERTAAAVSFGFPLSRSLCGLLISSLPQARETGMLSDLTKETAFFKLRRIMIGSLFIFGVLFFMTAGTGSLWIFGVLAVFFGFSRRRFLREFGGITGDLSGYFVTVSELLILIGAAVLVR